MVAIYENKGQIKEYVFSGDNYGCLGLGFSVTDIFLFRDYKNKFVSFLELRQILGLMNLKPKPLYLGEYSSFEVHRLRETYDIIIVNQDDFHIKYLTDCVKFHNRFES